MTQCLVEQLDSDSGITVDQAMRTWWFNIRKNGGMRLTGPGYDAFTNQLHIARYEWTITDPLAFTQRVILALDRKLHMPYYISSSKGIPKKIVLFGSQEAVMINLYGDLVRWLDSIQS